jgi:beta-glucanase (GH16 family)
MDGQGNLKMTIIDVGSVQCTDYYGNPSQLTSAGMDTGGGRFLTNKGRFEVRAKLSCATGVWGSIWTSGTPWPTQGEIDIWESMDGNLQRIKHTVHAGRDGSAAEKWHKGQTYTINERFCDKYRVYAAEWRDGYIQLW